MKNKNEYICNVLLAMEQRGLTNITPNTLSEGGNLIVHLAPHPIVARIAMVRSMEDGVKAFQTMNRELQVTRHLHAMGVPVLLPSDLAGIEPLDVDGTWMTLWEYIPRISIQPLRPEEDYLMVDNLSVNIQSFQGELPPLGVWEGVTKSAQRLEQQTDSRIKKLLKLYQSINEEMRSGTRALYPCHGDAHARNTIASQRGWLWMDFEDVSLMPVYWDKASYVANRALMSRYHEPSFHYMLEKANESDQLEDFQFAITARVLMSTLGNLDYALRGDGDLTYASRQLELVGNFINELPSVITKRGRRA
ncbi:phosphotransferase [Paenibacillus sp. GSMTC-2017]|uniref:phosphotransferase n=1 Tax=Paenibacillus sp. GSMTC-2017 TaxID=2794350 RepID=UPI0018D87C0E|nr:phosphotransferase [Paenibacillus sp. GSMTC-2017]MBH5320426.1 phosphotransferase [Paenibacillus sp. GSMTC-2017]